MSDRNGPGDQTLEISMKITLLARERQAFLRAGRQLADAVRCSGATGSLAAALREWDEVTSKEREG